MPSRQVPITLNGKTYVLYFTASLAMGIAATLRDLGRLEKKDTEREAFTLVRNGDSQAITVLLGIGLDNKANENLTRNKNIREQIGPWLDDEVANHRADFGERIQLPILEAAKSAGLVDFIWKKPEPGAD